MYEKIAQKYINKITSVHVNIHKNEQFQRCDNRWKSGPIWAFTSSPKIDKIVNSLTWSPPTANEDISRYFKNLFQWNLLGSSYVLRKLVWKSRTAKANSTLSNPRKERSELPTSSMYPILPAIGETLPLGTKDILPTHKERSVFFSSRIWRNFAACDLNTFRHRRVYTMYVHR